MDLRQCDKHGSRMHGNLKPPAPIMLPTKPNEMLHAGQSVAILGGTVGKIVQGAPRRDQHRLKVFF